MGQEEGRAGASEERGDRVETKWDDAITWKMKEDKTEGVGG